MFSQARVCLVDFRRFDELAPGPVCKECDGTELAAIVQMSDDFARDANLIFAGHVVRKMRTMLDERFLRLGGFAVNETDEADQLVPGRAVRVAVLSGVNRGEFPLFLPGKRLDSLPQTGGKNLQFLGRALRGTGLPKIRAEFQVLHV